MVKVMNKILDSDLYNADIQKTALALKWIAFPKSSTFFITGSTGLICSTVVDVLFYLNKAYNLKWKIIAGARDLEKANGRFYKYIGDNSFSILKYDALSPFTFAEKIDYIIHGAGNAYPAVFCSNPVDTIISGILGLKQVLEYGVENHSRILYISSSEVYGQLIAGNPIKENEYGCLDILNPRSAYPIGKIACENLCAGFINQYSSDCIIVRPGHVYGPTASIKDNRVSSEFMYLSAQGKNIVLKSKGEQIRSYCYCLDCASAIIAVLFAGQKGEAYNISNSKSICSIAEMAKYMALAGNVNCIYELPNEKEKTTFNPMANSALNSEKLETLGWKAVFEKEEGFEHSVRICKEILG